MLSLINNLLQMLLKALTLLLQFLIILALGLLVVIVLVLPWLLRALALVGWAAGTFLLWMTLEGLYGSFTETVPLLGLQAVPVILGLALVVWVFYIGRPTAVWGAMTLWSVLGFLVWRFAPPLLHRLEYGEVLIRALPAILSSVLLIWLTARWGPVVRAKRLAPRTESRGGKSEREEVMTAPNESRQPAQ